MKNVPTLTKSLLSSKLDTHDVYCERSNTKTKGNFHVMKNLFRSFKKGLSAQKITLCLLCLLCFSFSNSSLALNNETLQNLKGQWHCQFDIDNNDNIRFESEYSLVFDTEKMNSFAETTMRIINKHNGIRSSAKSFSVHEFIVQNNILTSNQISSKTHAITDPFGTLTEEALIKLDNEKATLTYELVFTDAGGLTLIKQNEEDMEIHCIR